MTSGLVGGTSRLEEKLEKVYRGGASSKFGYKDITQQSKLNLSADVSADDA
jgi:hypothetical protein